MDEFEHRLASELRPVPAPDGFTAGVMKRLGLELRILELRTMERQRRGRIRWAQACLVAAVLLAMLYGGVTVERQHRRQAQEQAARQQFDFAMQVTGRTIYQAQQTIRGIGLTSVEVKQ